MTGFFNKEPDQRESDLPPVGYFHVVFTLPIEVADISFHNKAPVPQPTE